MEHGKLMALMQPAELVVIGGAALKMLNEGALTDYSCPLPGLFFPPRI